MPELRWILLILGALFIGVLAVWEVRRKRHARGQEANAPAGRDGERVAPTLDEGDTAPRAVPPDKSRGDFRAHREPTLTFPEVHPEGRGERAPIGKPRVVEIDEASLADLKVEPHTVVDEFSAPDRSRASDEALGLRPTVPLSSGAQTVPDATSLRGTSSTGPRLAASGPARTSVTPDAPELPRMAATRASGAPRVETEASFNEIFQDAGESHSDFAASTDPTGDADADSADVADNAERADAVHDADRADAVDDAGRGADHAGRGTRTDSLSHPSRREPSFADEDDTLSVDSSTDGDSEVLGPAVVRKASPLPLNPEAFATPEPIVDWPDESSRKIIALRLVSGSGERFQGRAVRQALAAEGFQIGKFEIFHKPGPDARAVLSVASLTKPGTFTLNTMDGQRYGGLSLFAVLPGPLPPVETFDELLLTARSLNDRLRGALQDERGEPLTPTRSASIRDNLASSAPSTPH